MQIVKCLPKKEQLERCHGCVRGTLALWRLVFTFNFLNKVKNVMVSHFCNTFFIAGT